MFLTSADALHTKIYQSLIPKSITWLVLWDKSFNRVLISAKQMHDDKYLHIYQLHEKIPLV